MKHHKQLEEIFFFFIQHLENQQNYLQENSVRCTAYAA